MFENQKQKSPESLIIKVKKNFLIGPLAEFEFQIKSIYLRRVLV